MLMMDGRVGFLDREQTTTSTTTTIIIIVIIIIIIIDVIIIIIIIPLQCGRIFRFLRFLAAVSSFVDVIKFLRKRYANETSEREKMKRPTDRPTDATYPIYRECDIEFGMAAAIEWRNNNDNDNNNNNNNNNNNTDGGERRVVIREHRIALQFYGSAPSNLSSLCDRAKIEMRRPNAPSAEQRSRDSATYAENLIGGGPSSPNCGGRSASASTLTIGCSHDDYSPPPSSPAAAAAVAAPRSSSWLASPCDLIYETTKCDYATCRGRPQPSRTWDRKVESVIGYIEIDYRAPEYRSLSTEHCPTLPTVQLQRRKEKKKERKKRERERERERERVCVASNCAAWLIGARNDGRLRSFLVAQSASVRVELPVLTSIGDSYLSPDCDSIIVRRRTNASQLKVAEGATEAAGRPAGRP
ncbi:hypothetical protein V9T40_007510 [Parthenolecanium corni]|uniref:Uncharacterized protein n=1 Tax=Parthenolecanium corni TaxID=536013 RepID=A0AAN9TK10_9HEMI